MKIIVAPNTFKGSISATQAAKAIARGVREVFPDAEVIEIPVADGGEGTGIITAQIDPERIANARGMVPSLQHDRGFTPPELTPLRRAAE